MDQVLYFNRVLSIFVHRFKEEAIKGIHELGTRLLSSKTQLSKEMKSMVLHEGWIWLKTLCMSLLVNMMTHICQISQERRFVYNIE